MILKCVKLLLCGVFIAASSVAYAQPAPRDIEVYYNSFTGQDAESGIKPFYVTIKNPSAVARELDVSISSVLAYGKDQYGNSSSCRVSIPPKSTHGFFIYHQLQYSGYSGYAANGVELNVYEGGTRVIQPIKDNLDFDDTPHFNVLVLTSANRRVFSSYSNAITRVSVITDMLTKSFTVMDAKVRIYQPREMQLLPASWIGYVNIDTIVINNFPMETLTPEQRQAIYDWHCSGGEIIVSPGADRNWLSSPFMKRLLPAGFADALVPGTIQFDEKKYPIFSIDSGVAGHLGIIKDTYSLGFKDLPNLKFVSYDISQEFTGDSDDSSLGFALLEGRSVTFTHAAFWAGQPTDYSQGKGYTPSIMTYMQYYLKEHFSFRPAIGYILILVIIYILVAAPLNYFYMKKRKLHMYVVLSIPAIALFFSILAYFMNSLMYGITNKAEAHTFSYKMPGRQALFNINYMLLQPSSTGTFDFQGKDGMYLFVSRQSRRSYDYYYDDDNLMRFECADTFQFGNGWDITDRKVASRETICLIAISLEVMKTGGSNITFTEGGDGKITLRNATDHDIDNAFFSTVDRYADLPQIAAGHDRTFSAGILSTKPLWLNEPRELEINELVKNAYAWFILQHRSATDRDSGVIVYQVPAPDSLPLRSDGGFSLSASSKYMLEKCMKGTQ